MEACFFLKILVISIDICFGGLMSAQHNNIVLVLYAGKNKERIE
jgi:hypothetical protein